MSLLTELKRRNVIRVALAYVGASWLIIQIGDTIFPAYDFPASSMRVLIAVLIIGFLPVVLLTWAFEWTPEGIVADAGADAARPVDTRQARRFDRIVIAILALALSYFLYMTVFPPPPGVPSRSVAVMPLANLSPDPDQAYFAMGTTEDLRNLLARVPGLHIVSGRERRPDDVLADLAEELGVAYLLEGSVRRAGDSLRISVHLVDAASGRFAWSETFDRQLGDVFAIQEEIAQAVTDALKIELLGKGPSTHAVDPKAYSLYLQARHLANRWNDDDLIVAKDLVDQALAIEPDYVEALALKARALGRGEVSRRWCDDCRAEIRKIIDRMYEIDPDAAHAHAWMAWYKAMWDGDLVTGAHYLERALAKDPTNLENLRGMLHVVLALGRVDEAIAMGEYVTRRSPFCAQCFDNLGAAYRDAGRWQDAEHATRTAIALSGASDGRRHVLGIVLLMQGRAAEALAELPSHAHADRALAYRAAGDEAGFADELQAFREAAGPHLAMGMALVEAGAGRLDAAFDWLERGLRDGGVQPWDLRDQGLRPLHDDPRWLPLQERYGVAPQQLASIDVKITLPPAHEP